MITQRLRIEELAKGDTVLGQTMKRPIFTLFSLIKNGNFIGFSDGRVENLTSVGRIPKPELYPKFCVSSESGLFPGPCVLLPDGTMILLEIKILGVKPPSPTHGLATCPQAAMSITESLSK